MRNISNTTRSNSYGEASWEAGDIAEAFTGKNIIDKANTILLTQIFNHYGLHIDSDHKKAICPFPSHKGGRESTASFLYYPHSNTYCCFGCRAGSTPVDFVSNMEHIDRYTSAYKILNIFGSESISSEDIEKYDSSGKIEILIDFSNAVRCFRQDYFDDGSFIFIEAICKVFDDMNCKHKLDNDALRRFVEAVKERIKAYIPCHNQ